MDPQSDGIHEAFQGQARVLITVAGQLAESMARSREKQLRDREATDQTAAEELRRRLAAERAAAEAAVKPAATPGWANGKTAEEVASAWQTANEWKLDPGYSWSSAPAEEARRQLHEWSKSQGLDFEEMQADIDKVRDAIRAKSAQMHSDATSLEGDAAELMTLAAEDLTDALEAQERDGDDIAAARAERDAQEHEEQAGPVYDSAERRRELAATLTARDVDVEGVSAAVLTDASTAAPVTEAVAEAAKARVSGKTAAKRRGRGKGSDRSLGR